MTEEKEEIKEKPFWESKDGLALKEKWSKEEQYKFFKHTDHIHHRFPARRGHDQGYRVRVCGPDRKAF